MRTTLGVLVVISILLGGVTSGRAIEAAKDYRGMITVHGRVTEQDLEAFDNVVEADMVNIAFAPRELTVEPGTTVVWVNKDQVFHNVHVRAIIDGRYETLDVGGMVEEGDRWAVTFHEEDRYSILCDPHIFVGMEGRVIVESS